MAAQLSYVYNNRLHIAGTTEYYTDVNKVQTSYTLPYYQDTMSNYQVWFLSHTNISVPQDSINAGYATLPTADFKAIVSFNDNTQKYLEGSCPWPLPPLLCFPDRNATEIELYVKLGSNYYHITKTLRQSASFDMAYSLKLDTSREFTFFENSDQDIQITETDYEHVEDDWLQEHANDKPVVNNNLLRYSEAVNPFVFPVNNYVPVGVSRITALATSTQPISEGQFGVAPLYVFTDEAVWALSVGNDGTYEARQPASRDVCSNPSAITPIDNAVVFPTERGLMLIAGGKSVCISEALRGSNIEGFDATPAYNQARAFLALAKDIIMVPGEEANTWVEGETDAFTYHDIERGFFDAFLQRAGIFYDYQNQRLVIFNKTSSTNLAYVYSLRSQQWGTAKTDIKAVTNSYPIPFASYTRTWENVTKKYVGWAIASSSEAVEANVFGCTRAMKFDAPMSFKTIRAAILKGDMSNTIKTALFASNDLRHWTLVNSSTTTKLRNKHGNPWRFYRLAFIGSLEGYFCIDGILVDYDVRWNNQIR